MCIQHLCRKNIYLYNFLGALRNAFLAHWEDFMHPFNNWYQGVHICISKLYFPTISFLYIELWGSVPIGFCTRYFSCNHAPKFLRVIVSSYYRGGLCGFFSSDLETGVPRPLYWAHVCVSSTFLKVEIDSAIMSLFIGGWQIL